VGGVKKRSFFQREVKQALDRLQEMLSDDIFVIPVRLDSCGIPTDLAQYHCEDLFGAREERGWQRLFEALEKQAEKLGKRIVKPVQQAIQQTTIEPSSRGSEQPQSFNEDLGNGVKLEMIYLPGGSFLMGSPDGVGPMNWEHPQHRVTLSPFYIGKYPVTQAQWQAVMGNNPSYYKGNGLPVENISWNDAQEFCKAISKVTGKTYRLPSEAEWEYACRAGSTGDYCFGDGEALLSNYAWYSENADLRSHPVGYKNPNAWGLYDMHGNVMEWCEDDWHDGYDGAPTEGRAWVDRPSSGSSRVIRGGCCIDHAGVCRSAFRTYNSPNWAYAHLGFRLART
jgi:formylglycine-generating enzyme required for sulfatase activity